MAADRVDRRNSGGRRGLGFEAGTGFLLAQAGADARRRWTAMLVERDLRPHHYATLMALHQHGAMSPGELCSLIGVDARNAGDLFDHLLHRGLIDRTASDEDRRRKLVVLTAEGLTTARDLTVAGVGLEDDHFAALTSAERRELRRLLAKLSPADGPGSAASDAAG